MFVRTRLSFCVKSVSKKKLMHIPREKNACSKLVMETLEKG